MAYEKNYSYVTFLTNNSYVRGVLLLKECLRRVKSKYPLLCLVTEDVDNVILEVLDKAGIKYEFIQKVKTPDHIMEHNMKINPRQSRIWENVYTKFQIFSLEQFDKIILLDADLLILKNLDHCFEMPHMTAALDGEYNHLWPLWPHFNTGFLVIKPNKKEFEKIVDFANNFKPEEHPLFNGSQQVFSDQEILNLYYSDWPNKPELHLNKYYNVFPLFTPGIHLDDIMKNSYFMHFVGSKPWEVFDTKYLGIPEQSFSVITWDIKINSRCNYPYEVAYTIIDLCYKNDFKDLDWVKLDLQGYFNYALAENCMTLFRDFEHAKLNIDKALKFQPDNAEFNALKEKVYLYKEASEVKHLVFDVLKRVYDNATTSGIPTLELQGMLNIIGQIDLDTDYALDKTIKYWNIIRGAVEKYLKDVYNEKRWNELD